MTKDEKSRKEEIIVAKKRRLHELELQAANYGKSVDPRITIEIEDIKEEIVRLEKEISQNVNVQGGRAAMKERSPEPVNSVELRRILTRFFNESELRTLCFDLKIDYENLPGQGKEDKARELVAYAERHGRTAELVRFCRDQRPNIDWQKVVQTVPPERLQFEEFTRQLGELLINLQDPRNEEAAANRLKDRRNNEAAAYFTQLSSAMEKVVESLRKNEVPRISGNEMNTLIHAFPDKTKGVFDPNKASETSALLADAAATAKTLDAYIFETEPSDSSEREQRLAVLERITGHCRGLAGILSKPA